MVRLSICDACWFPWQYSNVVDLLISMAIFHQYLCDCLLSKKLVCLNAVIFSVIVRICWVALICVIEFAWVAIHFGVWIYFVNLHIGISIMLCSWERMPTVVEFKVGSLLLQSCLFEDYLDSSLTLFSGCILQEGF
jgi:hypothetical protein